MLHKSNMTLEVIRARLYYEISVFTKFGSIRITKTIRFDAYNFLIPDAVLGRTFADCPPNLRKNWSPEI